MKMFEDYQKKLLNSISQATEWHSRDKTPRPFIVKLHDATRLHYDFRLGFAGVLISWVLPEGPCLDATLERLAIRVDDHAINKGFEGVIPDDRYGAGPTMVWDEGFWITDQNIDDALRAGQLHFQLEGQKLKRSWTLTRLRYCSGRTQEEWVLRKMLDIEARSFAEYDIVVEQCRSVRTRRNIEEVARGVRSLMPGRRPRRKTRDPNQLLLFADDLGS
mgnify:CR=1 FL=1